MFGYIRPLATELKVRQHNKYKAIYCGLCKSLGKNSSQSMRMALQYDMASFAYLIGELAGDTFNISDQVCVAHPLKKRPISADNKTLEYCAHITSLLAYNKLDDMWIDEKKLYAPIGKSIIKRGYKKSKSKYYNMDREITEHLKTLHDYEQQNEKCIDFPASTTANIMELIGQNAPIEDHNTKRALASMMRNLGIWLYLADAADDAKEDIKKNNYNPLISEGRISIENVKTAKEVMTYSLVQAAKARDLLTLQDAGEFIDNIIYLALPGEMDRIFMKYDMNEKQ